MTVDLKTVKTIDPNTFNRLITTFGEVPTAFTESMTYYELLAWLCDYLEKTVLPAVNDNAEALAELQAKYIELHDYVEHYFDNLDVQEEINNKLDAMAEAGTLQEIIGDYLNATAVWGFDSVADMKASTNLIEGSFAKTLGYYAKGDGGSGYYKIVTDAVTTDEAFYIALTGNLKAKLIVNSEVNIKTLGAKGDDTTNDTAAFTKAVNSGLDIYLPQGTYLVENITLVNRQAIRGENMTKSIIKSVANNSEAHIITLNYNDGVYNILKNSKERKGKKSFHILMMHYFEDMYYVLKEMYRVLTPNSKAYLILGDSAPYGVYVPTTRILGDISQSLGFGDYEIYKIRERGNKWKNLKNRHNVELSENILILSR